MSIEAMQWALKAKVSGTKKVVLIGIASHADAYGDNAWPSLQTLAGYAYVSVRAVQQAISELIRDGFMCREINEGGSHRLPDHMRPNLYKLNLDFDIDPVQPASPPRCSQLHPPGAASFTPPVQPASPELSLDIPKEIPKEIKAAPSARSAKKKSVVVEVPEGVTSESWSKFLAIRKSKRLPLTKLALDGITEESKKAGMSPQAVVDVCISNNWGSFKAEWIGRKPKPENFKGVVYVGGEF